MAADSTKLVNKFGENSFDCVLLDAPCSGIGLRPRLCEEKTARDVDEQPTIQKKLIREAIRLVKEGGTIVYSTCTMMAGEGEGVIGYAMRECGEQIELVDATHKMYPMLGTKGVASEGLTEEQACLITRFIPPEHSKLTRKQVPIEQDHAAFFIAKLVKKHTTI